MEDRVVLLLKYLKDSTGTGGYFRVHHFQSCAGQITLFQSLKEIFVCKCGVKCLFGGVDKIGSTGHIDITCAGCGIAYDASADIACYRLAAHIVTNGGAVGTIVQSMTEIELSKQIVLTGVTCIDEHIHQRVIIIAVYAGIFGICFPIGISKVDRVDLTLEEQLQCSL